MALSRTFAAASGTSGRGPRGVWLIRVFVVLLATMGLVAQPMVASGAGTAVISASATPVNYLDGSPAPTAGMGINGNKLAYRVSYSCSVSNCDGATVKIAPTQLDPNHGYTRLLVYQSWTAPPTGGTITGTAATGLTVNLGNLPVGASGTFTVVFIWGVSGSLYVDERSDVAGSVFPNDFPLTIDLTADATTAVAPYAVTSTPSLWKVTTVNPGIIAATGSSALTDTNYSYQLRMGTGCMSYILSAAKGDATKLCASDYTVTHTLPAGAVLVSVSGDSDPSLRSYDPVTNTITWTAPTWATTGKTAEVGWHTQNNWNGTKPRIITVKFPAATFAPSGQTCDFTTPVTISSSVTATYISMPGVAGEVRTGSDTRTLNVFCVTPFGKAIFDAKVSTYDGAARESTSVSGITIPKAPAVNEKYWQVQVGNQANVEGVAVITDNTLDLADAPVYKIASFINGVADDDAVIAWEATDGTTTQTGSAFGTADADILLGTGWHFTKATVTTGSLAGPNAVASGSARTNAVVQYNYRVSSTATPGATRTNTASAVMTYPGTTLADINLGSRSHNIHFNAPFAKAGSGGKDSSNDGVSGETRLVNVPATGVSTKYWAVRADNQANVPGVAVITDNQLGQANAPVLSISANVTAGATVAYELDNGVTGTVPLPFTAPTGRSVVKATVTSGALAGPNATPAQTASTQFLVYFYYQVSTTAPVGEYRTNTASAVMTYPGYPALNPVDLGSASRTIRFSTAKATIASAFVGAAAIAGGGSTATPTTDVTFTVRGSSATVYATVDITPQYVFVAPAGWAITPGSASFASGTVPAGVTFSYRTVIIGGVSRQEVVASWPNTVAFGKNMTWPNMTVVARPTYAVAAGTTSVATYYAGDSRHTYSNTEANYGGAFQDTPDIDGDGVTTEWFASATQSVSVGAAAAMNVVKEICSPNSAASDGCTWISDSSTLVGVAPNSTSIKYRLTVQNAGNTTLSAVVGYDVLPYVGDVGTSTGTAGTPRNSDFAETVNAVSGLTSGVVATYSTSTNPPRPEVFSGTTTGTWTGTSSGAQAIRMSYPGSLSPGASVSMVYTANVIGSPVDGNKACNSFAVKVTGIGTTSEPAAVCAAIQEADLAISVPAHLPLQQGRPGTVPFTVVNNGGSPAAIAQVTLTVPAGITVTSLTPTGWSCVANPTGTSTGPLTLLCDPVDGSGLPRKLALGVPETITLSVMPAATTASLCIGGAISGPTYDGTLANNSAAGCSESFSAANAIVVTKDDARSVVAIGDTYTYTLVARNGLVGEQLSAVVLTDTLPAGLEFVSAADGGVLSGNVVTWPAFDLSPSGTASAGGNVGSGGVGSSFTTSVTVRVLSSASASIVNSARVAAADPQDLSSQLIGTASDTDTLRKLAITKTSTASSIGALAGETLTYTVTVTNIGTAAYTVGSPAAIRDELAAVTDDATFVAGSASVSVDGGAAQAVVPASGVLAWSGALAAGTSAVLTYQVLVGDGTTGDRILTNPAYSNSAGTGCDPATGLDTTGFACVISVTPFAPSFTKTIASYEQLDNGTWRVVYALDVVNLNAGAAVTYSISDSLMFGTGIPVGSAQVTVSPAGVTTAAWTGSGAVVSSAVLPPAATHHYELTVVTGAFVPATSSTCVTNAAGGFGNSATFAPVGGTATSAFVCAQPTLPTITKTVGSPTQATDGTWNVVYTVTVTAPAGTPAGGLAYTIGDTFGFPAGVAVNSVGVAGPAGSPTNPAFNGTSATPLLTAADRVSSGSPRVFTVSANTSVPAGSVTGADLACAPAGTGGYANAAVLYAGTAATVLGQAPACAAITAEPTPLVEKRVVSTSIDGVTGYWTIDYEITVTNPSATLVTTYDLDDELQYGAGISVIGAPVIGSTDATVEAGWDGDVNTLVVADQPLAAGAVHTYTITVVADTVTVTDANIAQMDCQLGAGETGTGFRNVATLASGVAPDTFAVACEAANDPSVIKTVAGTPVQDPATGIWTLEYTITVTNRATTSPVGGIPYTLTDHFGLPAGTMLTGAVEVDGPAGATLTAGFDGDTQSTIGTGSLDPAIDASTPTQHVYKVTVHFTAAGGLSPADQYCDPAQGPGGLRNEVSVAVGARVTGDVACTDSPDVPTAGVGKEVLSQTQQSDGTWLVLYRISVANPDPSITTVYDLEDQFQLGGGISLAATPTIVAMPLGAVIEPSWNGAVNSLVAEQMVLAGGATHTYTVRAVIDSGSVTSTDAAGDCVLDGATESGTGFTNSATVLTGTVERADSACITAFDPVVSKTISGEPVRNADGSFTINYVVTVQNPSPSVDLAYELTDELAFPAGTAFDSVAVDARTGGPATSSTWDGVADTVVVASGTALAGGATHVFDVSVTVTLPAGQGSLADGWANTATVASSTNGAVTSEETALADVELPELEISKSSDAATVVRIGDTVTYTVTVENTGVGDYTAAFPAEVWDYLEGVIDDATFGGNATASPAVGSFTYEPDRFSWSGVLLAGDSVDLTYSVVVTGEGDQDMVNVAFAPSLPGTDPDAPLTCDPGVCDTLSTPLPAFMIEKTASAGVATAGQALTYTMTYTNTGTVDVTGATFSDDLSDVHDDAPSVVPTATSGTATVVGDDLTWVGDLTAGQSVTVTYAVTIAAPLTGDGFLSNTATSDPDFGMGWPGGTCPSGPAPCADPDRVVTVDTAVRALAFTKTADATRTTVGQKVTYTITLTNIGTGDYTVVDPASVVDNLTGVLDDATYNGDASAASGNLAYMAPTLGWSGPLAAGDTVVVTFSVTVKPQLGDARLFNVVGLVSSTSAASACLATPTDNAAEDCFVSTIIEPLASTGSTMSLTPWLIALLVLLLGAVGVLLDARRRRRNV